MSSFFMGIHFNIYMIKLRPCGKYSVKRCIIFLSFYSLCIMFLSFHLKDKLVKNVPGNCTIQNIDALEKEKHLIRSVDNYIKKFLQYTAIGNIPESQKWTLITSNVYVYSAFFEICPPKLVFSSEYCIKFIAIVFSNSTSDSPFLHNLKCALKRYDVISEEESVILETLPESHDKLFSAAFLFCPLKGSYPTHAAIYKSNSLNLSWLSIENFELLPKPKLNETKKYSLQMPSIKLPQGINLCVRPLYNKLVIVHLIEFLVYYSIMGVDHFIFYHHKSFKPLETLLKSLKFSNVSSEVFVWDIPLNNNLIHEYGQIAFTQDCLARSKNRFKHSIITDLDEFIVPTSHKDLKSLVSYLDETHPYAGSYVVPMVLFCYEYSVQNSQILPFHILNFNRRQETHWPHHYRSKYIVRPDRVRYSGVHFTWKLEKNFKEIFLSPNIALVNHYRHCCGMMQTWFFHLFEFQVLSDKVIVDNTLLSHRDELMSNNLFKLIISFLSKNVS